MQWLSKTTAGDGRIQCFYLIRLVFSAVFISVRGLTLREHDKTAKWQASQHIRRLIWLIIWVIPFGRDVTLHTELDLPSTFMSSLVGKQHLGCVGSRAERLTLMQWPRSYTWGQMKDDCIQTKMFLYHFLYHLEYGKSWEFILKKNVYFALSCPNYRASFDHLFIQTNNDIVAYYYIINSNQCNFNVLDEVYRTLFINRLY